jgi:hypothetical protein
LLWADSPPVGDLYPFHQCHKYEFAEGHNGIGSGHDHSEKLEHDML